MIRVGCATSALDSIKLFAGRSKARAAMLDLDTLERMLNQDASEFVTTNKYTGSGNSELERLKYCALTEKGYRNLQNAISKKRLDEAKVCVPYEQLSYTARSQGFIRSADSSSVSVKYVPGISIKQYCDNTVCKDREAGCCEFELDDGLIAEDYKEKNGSWKVDAPGRCKITDGWKWNGSHLVKKTDAEKCTESEGKWASDKKCCNCTSDCENKCSE